MADVELLPLPEAMIESYQTDSTMRTWTLHSYSESDMRVYARANVAHATAALQAEVEELRVLAKKVTADLMESDEIREKLGHLLTRTAAALKGEPPAGVWHSWHDLPERAERLKEALEEVRSRSSIDLVMRSDQFELTALLSDIYQIADDVLWK